MNTPISKPFAYFITFTCYGTWLHGNEKSSVDRKHNQVWQEFILPNEKRNLSAKKRMQERPYFLDDVRRKIVLESIKNTCEFFNWYLFAAHVRSNHVHLVINANQSPSIILHRIKAYASQELNKYELLSMRKNRWTKHGSTKYLWDERAVSVVMHYVVNMQGERMECYEQKI